jgi:hypothetical protein
MKKSAQNTKKITQSANQIVPLGDQLYQIYGPMFKVPSGTCFNIRTE